MLGKALFVSCCGPYPKRSAVEPNTGRLHRGQQRDATD